MYKNKKLAQEILKRVAEEQKARKNSISGKSKVSSFKKLDLKNTKRLKEIIKEFGWPTISLVGKKASNGAWLLAQHADHDITFQKKVLILIKKIYKNNPKDIVKSNIAYLTDRILFHENKPQIFGTQYKKNKENLFEEYRIKDKKNVNKRRKAFGLYSLSKNTLRINKEWKKFGGK